MYKSRVQEEIQAEYESRTQRHPRWHLSLGLEETPSTGR